MNKNSFRDLIIASGTIIAVSLIFPVIDGLSSLIQSAINVKINKMQIGVELDNREAQAAAEVINPAPNCTQAIGFQIDSGEVYEDDYE